MDNPAICPTGMRSSHASPTSPPLRSARHRLGLALSLAVLAAGSCALLMGAPPADAHGTSVPMGWGHGGVTDSHYFAYACDDRNDGRGVYNEYRYARGGVVYAGRVGDANGSAAGCSQKQTPGPVIQYRICRDNPGAPDTCSGWKAT